jgi:hypothetical protein
MLVKLIRRQRHEPTIVGAGVIRTACRGSVLASAS